MPRVTLEKIVRMKIVGKSPVSAYLRLNQLIWNRIPAWLRDLHAIQLYGVFLHALVSLSSIRAQNFGTFFFRNRPQIELIRKIANEKAKCSNLNIAVMACSKGAEVYSIMWVVRSARSDLKIAIHAVDISKDVLQFAKRGCYSTTNFEFDFQKPFQRMTEKEMEEMFDKRGHKLIVKKWIREGIVWHNGDAGHPRLKTALGLQDIVIANNFLCHLDLKDSEKCLRNISRLVRPGGYLFVSGVDLDIRTKVARELGWKPIESFIEEMHDGDPSLRFDWPWKYWGLEPFNRKKRDWRVRYASTFKLT